MSRLRGSLTPFFTKSFLTALPRTPGVRQKVYCLATCTPCFAPRGCYKRLYADKDVYVFGRKLDAEVLLIALNTAFTTRCISFSTQVLGLNTGEGVEVWNDTQWPLVSGTVTDLRLAPRSGVVLVEHSHSPKSL